MILDKTNSSMLCQVLPFFSMDTQIAFAKLYR